MVSVRRDGKMIQVRAAELTMDEAKEIMPTATIRRLKNFAYANGVGRNCYDNKGEEVISSQTERVRKNVMDFLANDPINHPCESPLKDVVFVSLSISSHTMICILSLDVPMAATPSEKAKLQIAQGKNRVVTQNIANAEEMGGTRLYRFKKLTVEECGVKHLSKYSIILPSKEGQKECNSLKIVKKLNMMKLRAVHTTFRTDNSLAVNRLDQFMANAGYTKYHGMIPGNKKAFTDTEHEHEQRAYYHPRNSQTVGRLQAKLV